MWGTAISTRLAGYKINVGAAKTEWEEWLDDTVTFEASVAKDFPFKKGILGLEVGTIQSFVIGRSGHDKGGNMTSIWRKLGPERFYLDTYKFRAEYEKGKYRIGASAYAKQDDGWGLKVDPFIEVEIAKNTHFKVGGVFMHDFSEYRDNNIISLSLKYSWDSE